MVFLLATEKEYNRRVLFIPPWKPLCKQNYAALSTERMHEVTVTCYVQYCSVLQRHDCPRGVRNGKCLKRIHWEAKVCKAWEIQQSVKMGRWINHFGKKRLFQTYGRLVSRDHHVLQFHQSGEREKFQQYGIKPEESEQV